MTIRPAVILSRLAHLGVILDELDKLRAIPAEERTSNVLYRLALERALHLAAEAIFDIGHHILAGRGARVPQRYRDVLPALAANGVLSQTLADSLDGLAGLRNLLVHDYAEIDHDRLSGLLDRVSELRAVHAALAAIPELGRDKA